MSRFKTVAPVMVYIEPKELGELKRYAKTTRKTVSQIVREGVSMRMAGVQEDPYSKGFKEGLNKAMELTRSTDGAQMKFPSGKSFGDLVCDEIERFSSARFNQPEANECEQQES